MKIVITYGTFDLFHTGHYNLLKRAKELGDHLIVGVTSDAYDKERGKLNVHDSLSKRMENVRLSGLADEIIVEEYEGQKITDIQKYNVDIFAIGSDWVGKFDYLNDYCKVVYLERTKGISSTQLRIEKGNFTNIGIVGCGRIAERFVLESKYVSGVNIESVYNPNLHSAKKFATEQQLNSYTDNWKHFISKIDAIYIASPHLTHYEYIKAGLMDNKHILCEKPMVMKKEEVIELYKLAEEKKKVLMCAIKTAYCPAFEHLLIIAKSGKIGSIKDVDASFTKLENPNSREFKREMAGGSFNELAEYPLLAITKLLGHNFDNVNFYSYFDNGVDLFTRAVIQYPHASASLKVGLGVKTEGSLVISGTKGYIYVPAPWWKTNYFEMRFENLNDTNKYFYKFEGDGLRYELVEFLNCIQNNKVYSDKLSMQDIITMSQIRDEFYKIYNG